MAACRRHGVIRYMNGPNGLELVFGPSPLPAADNKAKNGNGYPPGVDPQKRAHYTNLLNRVPSDEELKHLP